MLNIFRLQLARNNYLDKNGVYFEENAQKAKKMNTILQNFNARNTNF